LIFHDGFVVCSVDLISANLSVPLCSPDIVFIITGKNHPVKGLVAQTKAH
jgi:hypothetical protein